MKKLKVLIVGFLCVISMFGLTACGSGHIDYDMSSSGKQLTYSTVLKVQQNDSQYLNKTFRLRGKLKNSSSTYHYLTDTFDACCTWTMEVELADKDMEYPKSTTTNYYVTGTYKSKKVGNRNSYYLLVSDISTTI